MIENNHINVHSETERMKNINMARKTLQLKYNEVEVGWYRIVYDLNNGYVLKVAHNSTGIYCNENEYEIYRNSPPHIQKLLCPVKDYSYGWIIMEKMDQKVPLQKKYDDKMDQLFNIFKDNGINPIDFKRHNLALSNNGEIIVIDYGDFII